MRMCVWYCSGGSRMQAMDSMNRSGEYFLSPLSPIPDTTLMNVEAPSRESTQMKDMDNIVPHIEDMLQYSWGGLGTGQVAGGREKEREAHKRGDDPSRPPLAMSTAEALAPSLVRQRGRRSGQTLRHTHADLAWTHIHVHMTLAPTQMGETHGKPWKLIGARARKHSSTL